MSQLYRCGIVHFNDVYHVSPSKAEPVGGAARFTTVVQESVSSLQEQGYKDSFVLFSGDAFSPSTESSITRGKHISQAGGYEPVWDSCGMHREPWQVRTALETGIYSHVLILPIPLDFDFGLPQLQKLMHLTNFPWLLSNVLHQDTNAPPEGVQKYLVIEGKTTGLRIGLIGLVEREWIATIPSFPPELKYYDFIEAAKQLSKELRDPNGPHRVDLVIALTHMRVPNDIKLGRECRDEIDLALGGHDHFYFVSKGIEIIGKDWSREQNVEEIGFDPEENVDENIRVVKSGTDFRELSMIAMDIERDEEGKCHIRRIQAERKPVTSDVKVDEETDKLVQDIGKTVSKKTDYAIGYTLDGLDGRSTAVRTRETNLGNLTSDLMMNAYNSVIGQVDAAISCGGTFRSDKIHGPGPITLGDILDIFPYEDPLVVIKLTGQQLWDALENGLSEYPKQEGRFPQVAGLRIEWNPSAAPGSRLRKVYCMIHTKKRVAECIETGRSPSPFDYEPTPLRSNAARYQVKNMVPLDLKKIYFVTTRSYMAEGYDGYTALKVAQKDVLIDDEQGVIISTLFRRFFLGLKYVNALRDSLTQKHIRQEKVKDVVAMAARKWRQKAAGIQNNEKIDLSDLPTDQKAKVHCSTSGIRNALSGSTRGHPDCIASESDDEDDKTDRNSHQHWIRRWATIAPSVDGRIVEVDY